MTWIAVDCELAGHPKTKRLVRMLGLPLVSVVGHLNLLWAFTMHYCPEGDLSRFEDSDIADACLFEGPASLFVDSLVNCGFLDRYENITMVHDWEEFSGRLHLAREANAERMREFRASQKDPARATNVQRTSQARVLPEERIGEDRTEEERKEEDFKGGADAPQQASCVAKKLPANAEQFQALAEVQNGSCKGLTPTQRGILNRHAKECAIAGLSGVDIHRAAACWRERYPDIPVTSAVIVKHATRMLYAPARASPNGRKPVGYELPSDDAKAREEAKIWRREGGKLDVSAPLAVLRRFGEEWGINND